MNVGRTKATKHILNANCYDVDCTGFECEVICTNGVQFAETQVQNVLNKHATIVGKHMQQ